MHVPDPSVMKHWLTMAADGVCKKYQNFLVAYVAFSNSLSKEVLKILFFKFPKQLLAVGFLTVLIRPRGDCPLPVAVRL